MKRSPILYSGEELAWIKACSDQPRAELHVLFVQIFNRADVSLVHLKSLCKRKGWLTGRTGCFPKGATPANKGKTMPFNANSAKTQFKKGQLPRNARGAGHSRVDRKDGYVIMIVDGVNPWTCAATRPVHKHKYLWEQAHGPVPDSMCLKCLDGDKTNTDPSNWKAIPTAMRPRLNGIYGRGYDAAPPELKPTIMAITELEHAARVARKGSSA